MSESIINGSQGIDTSDATANNSQILSGATAYVNGVKVTGNMPNRGSWGTSISPGSSVTIPSGYHSGGGSVRAGSASPTEQYAYCYAVQSLSINGYGASEEVQFVTNGISRCYVSYNSNCSAVFIEYSSEYPGHYDIRLTANSREVNPFNESEMKNTIGLWLCNFDQTVIGKIEKYQYIPNWSDTAIFTIGRPRISIGSVRYIANDGGGYGYLSSMTAVHAMPCIIR